MSPPTERQWLWIFCGIFILNFAFFLNNTLILDDPAIVERALGATLADIFHPGHSFLSGKWIGNTFFANGMYRPVSALSFFLDAKIFGKAFFLWRLENILLHALNLFLIFRLVKKILGERYHTYQLPILLCLTLMAIHPTIHHATLWISLRPDLLGLAFFLVGFEHFATRERPPYLGILFFCLASLCKETFLLAGLFTFFLPPKLFPNLKFKFKLAGLFLPLGLRFAFQFWQRHTAFTQPPDGFLNFYNSHFFWDLIPGHFYQFLIAPLLGSHFGFMRIKPFYSESLVFLMFMLFFWAMLFLGCVQSKFKDIRIGCIAFIALLLPRMFSTLSGGGSLYYFGFWNTYPCIIALAPLYTRLTLQLKRPGLLFVAILLGASTVSNLIMAPTFARYFSFAKWQYTQMPENIALAKNILFQSYKQKQYQEGVAFFESIENTPALFYLKPFNQIMFERDHLCTVYNYAGILFGYTGQITQAKSAFVKQTGLTTCYPEERLDALYRLYLIAKNEKNIEENRRWRKDFLDYFESVHGTVNEENWKDVLLEMNGGEIKK